MPSPQNFNMQVYNPLPHANSRESKAPAASKMDSLIRGLLVLLGEDPQRDGLLKTPQRAAKALREMTNGYGVDIDNLINNAIFKVDCSEMVLVKDIPLYSLCEHHILPFFGKAHVAYIPNQHVIGLSKIPRIIEVLSKRLQMQERLTRQIAQVLEEKLEPLGVGVILKARHLCMEMRGVNTQNPHTITTVFKGVFQIDPQKRGELFRLVGC